MATSDLLLQFVLIITIGGSIFLKGAVMLTWGKDTASLPSFSGEAPIHFFGASSSTSYLG